MAKVVREKAMEVGRSALFNAITDFSKYPEFLPEVVGVEVNEGSEPGNFVVQFELELIKRFSYQLEFRTVGEEEIHWHLLESNFFKTNEGRWLLKALGPEKTDVQYELEVGFGFFVPKFIAKKLTEVNLPKMFDAFEKRALELQ